MIDFNEELNKFKNEESKFDENKFNIKNNNYKLYGYVNNIILKNKYNTISKYINEKELNGDYSYAFLYRDKTNTPKINVPKRHILFDELVYIHELTHLVNELNNEPKYTISQEVIPYFNEYEYLKRNYNYLLKNFLELKKKIIIDYNKNNNDYKIDTYIYAYLLLLKRKDDYNIYLLNHINKEKNYENKLIKKDYKL